MTTVDDLVRARLKQHARRSGQARQKRVDIDSMMHRQATPTQEVHIGKITSLVQILLLQQQGLHNCQGSILILPTTIGEEQRISVQDQYLVQPV